MFRFPMHLLGSLERATNNNIEHQGLDYVHDIAFGSQWAIQLRNRDQPRKLLGGAFSAEHNFRDLQRGDFASQTAGYQALRNIGVYHADNILKQMRQNPIGPEKGGEILTVQGAMINLESLLNPGEASVNPNVDPNPIEPGTGEGGDPAAKRRLVRA